MSGKQTTPHVRSVFRTAAAMLVCAFALLVGTGGAALADPPQINLPLSVTVPQATAACKKVMINNTTQVCVDYVGEARTKSSMQQNGKIPVSDKIVGKWYDSYIASCMAGDGNAAGGCLDGLGAWGTDIQKHGTWTWKCSSPRTLTDMASCFEEATTRLVGTALTFWMSPKLSPQVAPRSDGGDLGSLPHGQKGFHWITWRVSSVVWTLQQSMKFLSIIVAALGIVVAGIRVAMTHRAQPLTQILQMFFTVLAVSGLAAVSTQIAVDWGDQFAPWVMKIASAAGGVSGSFQDQWTANFSAINQLAMLLVFGPLLMLAGLAQVMLMIVRDGAVVIMVGLLPLAASATSFEAGRQWFKKICMWLLGLVLYKPAAAVIYGVGLMLMNRAGQLPDSTDSMTKKLVQMAAGMVVLLLAIACLPAMVKLFMPLAATGASAAFSGAAVAGAAVTGAVAATSVMTGGGLAFAGAAAAASRPTTSGADVPGSSPSAGAGGGSGGPWGGGDSGSSGPQVNGYARPELESPGNRLPPGPPSSSQVAAGVRNGRALPTGGGEAPVTASRSTEPAAGGAADGSTSAAGPAVGDSAADPGSGKVSGSAAWVASGTSVTPPASRAGSASPGGPPSPGGSPAAGAAPVVRQGRAEVVAGAVHQAGSLSEQALEAEE